MIRAKDIENKLKIVLPPLFRQQIEKEEVLQSENSEFYTGVIILNKFSSLKEYSGKKGFAIADWGTEDAYVLLVSDGSESALEETIYLYDKELNQVSPFSESIETLLEDEREFFL